MMRSMRENICLVCSYSSFPAKWVPPSKGRATWPEMNSMSPARIAFDHRSGPTSATSGTDTFVLGMASPSESDFGYVSLSVYHKYRQANRVPFGAFETCPPILRMSVHLKSGHFVYAYTPEFERRSSISRLRRC